MYRDTAPNCIAMRVQKHAIRWLKAVCTSTQPFLCRHWFAVQGSMEHSQIKSLHSPCIRNQSTIRSAAPSHLGNCLLCIGVLVSSCLNPPCNLCIVHVSLTGGLQEFVTCEMCKSANTDMARDSSTRLYMVHCHNCSASRSGQ